MKSSQSASFAAIVLLLVASSAVAGNPEKCQAGKTKAVGKYLACRLKVDAGLAAKNELPAVDSYAKCDAKLAKSWGGAEAKYTVDCPTTGDQTAIGSLATAMATYLGDSLAGPPDACTASEVQLAIEDCTVADCSGTPTDTDSDANNCGACGNVCSLQNATDGCSAGACTVTSCDAGFGNCNGMPGDGCEVGLSSDPSNCSSCGLVCNLPNATESCTSGNCGISSCDGGYLNCDGLTGDGCEVSVTSDPGNCGSCGLTCGAQHATAGCSASTCTVGICDSGFSDCDGMYGTGCEVNVNNDSNNCGNCGHICNLPNATSNCSTGSCSIVGCSSGFSNCNGNPADGCEIHSSVDPLNCGSCNQQCSGGTPNCSGGTCVP